MNLLGAFLAQVVIVTYRSYAGGGVAGGGIQVPGQAPLNLPLPSNYTAPIVVYGLLGLVPGQAQHVAGLIGWGLVVATFLNLWDPTGHVKQTTVGQGPPGARTPLPAGVQGPVWTVPPNTPTGG